MIYGDCCNNVYSIGNININNSSGIKNLGGIIGINGIYYTYGDVYPKITSSFYAGNIILNNSTIEYLGGIIGTNTSYGNIENCYFLKNENINNGIELVGIEENKLIDCGFKESEEELFSQDFLINTLGWNQSVWNITGKNYPEFY